MLLCTSTFWLKTNTAATNTPILTNRILINIQVSAFDRSQESDTYPAPPRPSVTVNFNSFLPFKDSSGGTVRAAGTVQDHHYQPLHARPPIGPLIIIVRCNVSSGGGAHCCLRIVIATHPTTRRGPIPESTAAYLSRRATSRGPARELRCPGKRCFPVCHPFAK